MHSIDVSLDNFKQTVISASAEKLVVLDFWAPWCGPCQSLMPILEKLAAEYQGQFILAKVNIDEQQQLAQQYAVRSVPTVKLIKQGEVVDEFTGALPEGQIRPLLEKHIVHESDQLMQAALQRYNEGDSTAIQDMINIINGDANNHRIRLLYVNVLLQEKQYDDARLILQSLPPDIRSNEQVAGMLSRLQFLQSAKSSPQLDELLQSIADDADNLEARRQLAAIYVAQSNYEAALEQFLEIMRRDRQFDDDAGRKGLLQVFDILGSHQLVSRYRQKMASLLY